MAHEPFIAKEDRPDLTVDMEGKVGDLTIRELATILGVDPPGEIDNKEHKTDSKDQKDAKDNKEFKDQKEQKDQKDFKEQKEHKEQKDQKEPKDQKDVKDHKEQKDSKDQKDGKDTKEHKEQKDSKDVIKDGVFDNKDRAKELIDLFKTGSKEVFPEKGPGIPHLPDVAEHPSELDELVKRISGLERSIEELKEGKK